MGSPLIGSTPIAQFRVDPSPANLGKAISKD
jgi:hypothetical protein